ncbi:MAG: hypothetical protein M3O09_18230 [Acidobacteriota bacterium]|nr:hypothetical protein [Acidobacteriota bacterium]
MHIHPVSVPLTLLLLVHLGASTYSQAECLSPDDAIEHVGETQCVSATIVTVERDDSGATALRLCEDSQHCGLTAVIAPGDLPRFKNLEKLIGSSVEIHGKLQAVGGRIQIALQERGQLRPQLASENKPLALPREYDADHKGSYSAGKFSHAKTAHKNVRKRQPATFPVDVPEDSEAD